MKIRSGVLTVVFLFVLTSTSSYAESSFLDKVKDVVAQKNITQEYKNLIGNTDNLLKNLNNQTLNFDSTSIKKILESSEELFGINSNEVKKEINKQLPGIIEGIKSQLEKTPNDTKLLIKLAIAYEFGAQYSLALTIAEKVLSKEPSNYNAAMIKAECYKLMGQTEKGAAYLEKFIKEQSNNPALLQMLASLKMDMGEEEKAIKSLEGSIAKFPEEKGLYEELAKIFKEVGEKGIQLFVDGKAVDFSKYGNTSPVNKNGTTLVPIRVIADYLDADISYSSKNGKVTLIYKGKTIVLQENKKTATVNNKEIKVDTVVQNIKGRVMVPLRFVSEQFSKDVQWFPFNKDGIVSIN
ncbi:MAG: stalk domain-containing protein [Ignavibacteriales bacterium]